MEREKFHHVVIGVAMLAIASAGGAQAPGGAAGSGAGGEAKAGSKDPFVECRNEIKAAKSAYDAKKISKQEYDEVKKQANAKLKATGVRGDFEKNLDCQP